MAIESSRDRRVARVSRAGGPDVLEIVREPIRPLQAGDVLVRVEAVGLNHAETLIRSGTYALRLDFPYDAGLEGAGTVETSAPDIAIPAGRGVAAVFDPIGEATFDASRRMLASRGCLINCGELSGAVPAFDLHTLFDRSPFVTKFNGRHYLRAGEIPARLIGEALNVATRRPAVISECAGRFSLDRISDAYRALESNPGGKILVVPV